MLGLRRQRAVFWGLIFFSLFCLLPGRLSLVRADFLGEKNNFFVDSKYELNGKETVSAFLKTISQKGYFYIENEWYSGLKKEERKKVNENLKNLAQEFDKTIYPKLTELYGPPWEPGIDNNPRITILFHQMKKGVGGYFNNGDEYSRAENPRSNKREMVYLNTDDLFSENLKSYLAHEFTHLITFNQKDRLRGVSEDIWLNEARAEYSPTYLNYNKQYQGSILQQRIKGFINSPSDSLTEWQNQKADYGVVSLFIHYLVDHYGIKILSDSMDSKKTGIASINEALVKNGFQKNFSQIFSDWTVTVLLNDCSVGENYCYKNENLKNIRITPSLIFLPSTKKTNLSLDYSIKQWAGHWYRVIGGKGDLKLIFDGQDNTNFNIPYALCKKSGQCQVNFFKLDKSQRGEVLISDFSKNFASLTMIPLIEEKQSNFSDDEPFYSFSLSISLKKKSAQEKLKEKLLLQIKELKEKIAELQAKINQLSVEKIKEIPLGFRFRKNLSLGMSDYTLIYLKKALISQGCFVEGVENPYFDKKTLKAVKCFCQKYKEEISQYAGYRVRCTGFVGRGIRTKLNQLLQERQLP
ncbi:hypothetical protein J7J18_05345 [bacterium]|nr:hypothetical protein [bacterium]